MKLRILILFFGILFFYGCFNSNKTTDRSFSLYKSNRLPFEFSKSDSCQFLYKKNAKGLIWFDLVYPKFQGRVYCSYIPVKENLRDLNNDIRRFLYRHTVVATNINESRFDRNKVSALLFEIKGKVASPLQFVITDSLHHFIRGAFYFDKTAMVDSLKPKLSIVRKDIVRLIETLNWKKQDVIRK